MSKRDRMRARRGSVKTNVMSKTKRCLWGGVICSCNLWCPVILLICPLSMHVTQLITAHRWSVRRQRSEFVNDPKALPCRGEHGPQRSGGMEVKARGSLKQWQRAARVKPIAPGMARLRCSFLLHKAKLIEIHSPSPCRGHLAGGRTHNLAQPLAAASAEERIAAVWTFRIRTVGAELTCGCRHFSQSTGDAAAGWGTCWNQSTAEMEVSSDLPCVCLLVNPFVRLPQISTWSPNWAPPFLPRNWWPD